MDPVANKVNLIIHRAALEAIFDECDRYDHDETGGRLLGVYQTSFFGGRLTIKVSGIIEPGPKARRTATSFFQDGEHQENVFRELENLYPDIEHLGNWHTHHVNGYPTLSGGDRDTYHRIVNHKNHNTNFFYALLVTARNSKNNSERYSIKNFILHRGNSNVYEIPRSNVQIVDRPIIWPKPGGVAPDQIPDVSPVQIDQRAIDNHFFKDLQPSFRPFLSKNTDKMYWRGQISLIDDSSAEIVIAEVEEGGVVSYGIAVKAEPIASSVAVRKLSNRRFISAREAFVLLEREINREIFQKRIQEARKQSIGGG